MPKQAPDPSRPQDLWHSAFAHCFSAKLLSEMADQDPDQGALSPSIHLLLGYTIELALKAAFLALGGEQAELRRIAHSLEAALTAATALGFRSQVSDLGDLVRMMQKPHASHQFRYFGAEQIEIPGALGAIERAAVLIDEVRRVVRDADPTLTGPAWSIP